MTNEELAQVLPIITQKVEFIGFEKPAPVPVDGEELVEPIVLPDGMKEIAAAEAYQAIINYCNIQKVPLPALLYVWASMSVDVIIFYKQTAASGAGTGESASSSSSESEDGDDSVLSGVGLGGLSVSFSQKSKSKNTTAAGSFMGGTSTLDKDKIVFNYTSHLDKFRTLAW